MPKILFTLVLIFIKVNNSYETDGEIINNKNIATIKPCTSYTIPINYQEESIFNFNIPNNTGEHELLINIHSINCNIEIINSDVSIKSQIGLNIYSMIMLNNSTTISIKPIQDIKDGRIKENYQVKECPIAINSYYTEIQELEIKNKEENVFYLNEAIDSLNISYESKSISNNSFFALYFKFKEGNFSIDISYNNSNNQSNSLSKIINESTYIYLNSEFLKYNNSDINTSLSISIKYQNDTPIYMYLKIIEEKTVCLLEKNALNFGFITSNTIYQYYYMEVLYGEEGELMLHNKRQHGILHAIIKNKTNIISINNITEYPNGNSNEKKLEYDQHYLQLKFNDTNTLQCTNGCYMLITYEQKQSLDGYHAVGYEFTILSRTWNQSDYISSIIDIPFNEYIISCFGKGSSREHFYSIYIPDDAETILIQLEGDYSEVFYEEGRKKVNTLKPGTKKIEPKSNQNITILKNGIDFQKGFMSFAFRPKDHIPIILPSYYLRVLYSKKKETKYLPINSNFGNLCLPEKKDNSSEFYYCYLKLMSNYNESNLNFVVSSTNQNEYVGIYIKEISNNIINDYTSNFSYIYNKNNSNIEYFLITFEFKNDEIKNILCSFSDKFNEIYPQIYSAEMFYLNNSTKTYHFQLKNSFSANYQFISGDSGNSQDILSSPNLKGKLITLHMENISEFNTSTEINEFIYYFQLIHKLKRDDMEELKQGKPFIQITNKTYFPLSYYYKIINKNYINIIVTFKINEEIISEINNFTINGYIINEDNITRLIKGEHIDQPSRIDGNYSDALNIGFLRVNQILTGDDNKYLYIRLENNVDQDKKSNKTKTQELVDIFIEILVKEYNNNTALFLPQSEYIIDTFDDAKDGIREENQYSIFNPKGNETFPVIELSSEFNDIKINFTGINKYKIENITGFQCYTIYESKNTTIYFNVTNKTGRKSNYMLIYYLNSTGDNYKFSLGNITGKKDLKERKEKKTDILLEFSGINVTNFTEGDIDFYITGTLHERNNKPEKDNTLNNTCFLQERTNFYTSNKNISSYNCKNNTSSNWTLVFKDIPRDDNYIYDLRLQIIARFRGNFLREEYLAFTEEIDLNNIKEKIQGKSDESKIGWYVWGIPVIVVGVVLIILGIFIIKFLRLRKSNTNLQQEMVSIAFSNDVQKNVLTKDMERLRSENDYENTFI